MEKSDGIAPIVSAAGVGGTASAAGGPAIGGSGGPTFFDPGTIAGTGSPQGDTAGKRKRGRPPGSGRKSAGTETDGETPSDLGKRRAPFSEDGVTAILLSIHSMLAGLIAVPELEIEASEAAQMARAIKGVADQYDIRPTEKALAWTNLVTAASMVYGTRLFAYRARIKAAKMDVPKPTNPANVLRMQ